MINPNAKRFITEQSVRDQNVVDALAFGLITWDQYFEYWKDRMLMENESFIDSLKKVILGMKKQLAAYGDIESEKVDLLIKQIKHAEEFYKLLTGREF